MAHPKLQLAAALVGSGLAGVLVALQSRINGGLSQQLGNGFVAAAISFGGGLVVMLLVLLVSRRGRQGIGLVRREIAAGRLPRWALLGGAGGAFLVLNQGLITPLIGVALFTVGIVAGQVSGGLVLDRLGLGPGGRIRATPTRLVGAALAIVAVVVTVAGALDSSLALLVLVPVIVGAGVAAQSMVNGLVRAAAQSAVTATLTNFIVGTALLVLAAVVSLLFTGWPTHWPSELWLYSGGLIGVVFIAVAAMLVRRAGVLLLSMSNVAGQLVAAIAFEIGFPLAGGLTPALVAGTLIALVAVVIAAVPSKPVAGRE
ncbi:DMT family transporter [Leucobacter albus]|uniref:DMT family transporter n=1 Tax=Leucobacter albus TaxID=272210 RepID=A0ABW3TL84_9MICO